MATTEIIAVPCGLASVNDPGSGQPAISAGTSWLYVVVVKESAGVVVMATRPVAAQLGVASGASGMTLPDDTPIPVLLPPAGKLYFAAQTAGQTVSVIHASLSGLMQDFAATVAAMLAATLQGKPITATPTPVVRSESKLGWDGKTVGFPKRK